MPQHPSSDIPLDHKFPLHKHKHWADVALSIIRKHKQHLLHIRAISTQTVVLHKLCIGNKAPTVAVVWQSQISSTCAMNANGSKVSTSRQGTTPTHHNQWAGRQYRNNPTIHTSTIFRPQYNHVISLYGLSQYCNSLYCSHVHPKGKKDNRIGTTLRRSNNTSWPHTVTIAIGMSEPCSRSPLSLPTVLKNKECWVGDWQQGGQ